MSRDRLKHLGSEVHWRREGADVSLHAVAAEVGISEEQLTAFERCEDEPDVGLAARIIRAIKRLGRAAGGVEP